MNKPRIRVQGLWITDLSALVAKFGEDRVRDLLDGRLSESEVDWAIEHGEGIISRMGEDE
jgi:hypothetical protein